MNTANPILDKINELPLMIAAMPPATLAEKAKGYAVQIALIGLATALKFGYHRGAFKLTKYTIPIYALTTLGVGYYILKYKKEITLIAEKTKEGFTTQV